MKGEGSAPRSNDCEPWLSQIAKACFVEELQIDNLPLPDGVRNAVLLILEDLSSLPALQAVLWCLAEDRSEL